MKIQLSPTKIIPDVLTVWPFDGPEVDIVMDMKNLTFREGSIEAIYSFHVLDHLFINEVESAVSNWFKCLAPNASVHILNDDFEYIARAFVGGDISIDLFNEMHNHPFQCTEENLLSVLYKAGFKEEFVVKWIEQNHPDHMPKKLFEFILTAKKHG